MGNGPFSPPRTRTADCTASCGLNCESVGYCGYRSLRKMGNCKGKKHVWRVRSLPYVLRRQTEASGNTSSLVRLPEAVQHCRTTYVSFLWYTWLNLSCVRLVCAHVLLSFSIHRDREQPGSAFRSVSMHARIYIVCIYQSCMVFMVRAQPA